MSLIYKPVKYVIFDMDGLLLDTETYYNRALTQVLARYGKEFTHDVKMKKMGTMPYDTSEIIVRNLGVPITPEQFLEQTDEILMKLFGFAQLLPGAERLVNHLSRCGIPIAVATSSGRETFEVKTAAHKSLMDKFHHVVIGSSDKDVKKGKPAPDIFLVAASRFLSPASPKECLVFEDAPNGVQAGISAGMQVVMVPDSDTPEAFCTLATKALKSLLDFKPEEFGLPPFITE